MHDVMPGALAQPHPVPEPDAPDNSKARIWADLKDDHVRTGAVMLAELTAERVSDHILICFTGIC